jgi:hypothetical protein
MGLGISSDEYRVLRAWYIEWTKASRLVSAAAFAAIGVTIPLFKLAPGSRLLPGQAAWIRASWALFGVSGIVSGASMLVAVIWMDAINRTHMPSLVGKAVFAHAWRPMFRLGTLGWISMVLAVTCFLIGMYCLLQAALLMVG